MIDWMIIEIVLAVGLIIMNAGAIVYYFISPLWAVYGDDDVGTIIGFIGLLIISVGMIMVTINVIIYIGQEILSIL